VRTSRFGVGLLGLALLTGTASPAAGYTETVVSDGGILEGVVRFIGKPLALQSVAYAENEEVCGNGKPSAALVLGPDRGVVGGVVLVQGVMEGKRGRFDAVLDGRRCAFAPRVVATMAGARARVRNSDPAVLSVRGLQGRATIFHVAIPSQDQEVDITRRLTRPGIIRVVSDTAPHMAAWMVVHDSPYLAVTDERGAFRIEDIPPGPYRVTVWHEGFRRRGIDKHGRPVYEAPHTITKEVTVAPRATATVAFDLR
jgi:hypothetical protein